MDGNVLGDRKFTSHRKVRALYNNHSVTDNHQHISLPSIPSKQGAERKKSME